MFYLTNPFNSDNLIHSVVDNNDSTVYSGLLIVCVGTWPPTAHIHTSYLNMTKTGNRTRELSWLHPNLL